MSFIHKISYQCKQLMKEEPAQLFTGMIHQLLRRLLNVESFNVRNDHVLGNALRGRPVGVIDLCHSFFRAKHFKTWYYGGDILYSSKFNARHRVDTIRL